MVMVGEPIAQEAVVAPIEVAVGLFSIFWVREIKRVVVVGQETPYV